jgi:hypothetical protein
VTSLNALRKAYKSSQAIRTLVPRGFTLSGGILFVGDLTREKEDVGDSMFLPTFPLYFSHSEVMFLSALPLSLFLFTAKKEVLESSSSYPPSPTIRRWLGFRKSGGFYGGLLAGCGHSPLPARIPP